MGEHIKDDISEQIIQIAGDIAAEEGAHKVTVCKILTRLGVTNRVFYNRFSNADEVLRIVYARSVEKTHECVHPDYTDKESFLDFCLNTAVEVLLRTYEFKIHFSGYIFEHDSLTEENRLWWEKGIRTHYQYALDHGFAKKVDPDALCYAIWCFCRGYYADAVTRKLPKEDAVRYFRFGFRCLIDGLLV